MGCKEGEGGRLAVGMNWEGKGKEGKVRRLCVLDIYFSFVLMVNVMNILIDFRR